MPSDRARRDERCDEVYHIQVQGLAQRLEATGIEQRRASASRAGSTRRRRCSSRPRRWTGSAARAPNILAYTMPGLRHQRAHARQRARADARAGRHRAARSTSGRRALQMLERHRASRSPAASRSTTSPSRTCRRASAPRTCSGSPTSTAGSWSAPATCRELALGWCTYGVGDQMSHYNVNASVPKTLIQHLIRWSIATRARRCADRRRAAVDPRHRDLAGAGARASGGDGRPIAAHRGRDRSRSSCRTSTSTTSPASASARAKWRSSRTTPGATSSAGSGRTTCRRRRGTPTTSPTIKHWLAVFLDRFFQHEPVQALGDAERAQGRLRRLALAARRLARAERRQRAGLARRARARSAC